MSIDNENDALDTENPGSAGVATAPSLDDLDAAMAALIRAASPSESTQAQSASQEPARSSGPAMALVNSVSIMDEDDDDDFFDDEEEESQEAAPAAQQRPSAPAPIPFRAPQALQEPAQAPQMSYQAPQPHSSAEYVPPAQPQYVPPQPAPQQEYVAPQPMAQHNEYVPPQAQQQEHQPAPQPVQQPQPQMQPLPQQASAPQSVAYQQPLAAAEPAPQQAPAPAQQNTVSQHARATLMHDTNQDKHLHDASKYIQHWLEQNSTDEEVIEAAMDWARKHKTAEHNGHVIASLLKLQQIDNEVTVMAVRWLTHHSMHQLAPEVVSGLTSRQ